MGKLLIAAAVTGVLLSAGVASAMDLNCRPEALAADTGSLPAKHSVMEGENLHLISCLYFGHARNWRAIYQANRGAIHNASRLEPGTVLTIPAL